MEIKFERVTDISEIDFDTMFDDSLERMSKNFIWSPTLITAEDKKEFYRNQLEDAFDGESYLQGEGEKFFAFKIIVDGEIGLFNSGFIEADGTTVRYHWYLVSPVNGSRMFIYADEATAARKQFYIDNGITQYKTPTHTGAPLYNSIKKNDVREILDVVDEVKGSEIGSTSIATFTIKI